jgi:hypothetical protein
VATGETLLTLVMITASGSSLKSPSPQPGRPKPVLMAITSGILLWSQHCKWVC